MSRGSTRCGSDKSSGNPIAPCRSFKREALRQLARDKQTRADVISWLREQEWILNTCSGLRRRTLHSPWAALREPRTRPLTHGRRSQRRRLQRGVGFRSQRCCAGHRDRGVVPDRGRAVVEAKQHVGITTSLDKVVPRSPVICSVPFRQRSNKLLVRRVRRVLLFAVRMNHDQVRFTCGGRSARKSAV